MVIAHQVTVLGRTIPVRSSASEQKVRRIETFVQEQVEQIRSRLVTADPQLVVTLALLNLAESYLELQDRTDPAANHQDDARLQRLLELLDQTLALQTPPSRC